jgi:hypothetical protein
MPQHHTPYILKNEMFHIFKFGFLGNPVYRYLYSNVKKLLPVIHISRHVNDIDGYNYHDITPDWCSAAPSIDTGLPPRSAYRRDRTDSSNNKNNNDQQQLSFDVVCSSNINRSMEAHLVLNNAGLQCASYGTGTQVRLPGRTATEPKIFKFGTPYSEMYHSLSQNPMDAQYFYRNDILQFC